MERKSLVVCVLGLELGATGDDFALHKNYCTHSAFRIFFPNFVDFKKSISGPIELKFSGKTLYTIL